MDKHPLSTALGPDETERALRVLAHLGAGHDPEDLSAVRQRATLRRVVGHRSVQAPPPMTADARTWRAWWQEQPVDVRLLTPPPGACPERVVPHDGDPSTPCVLPAGHEPPCEDPEGYASW